VELDTQHGKGPDSDHIMLFLSQRLSRSSLFQCVGKTLLRAAGITLLPFLPTSRVERASAMPPPPDCSLLLCGLCGVICGSSSCPTGTTKGSSYWTGCCSASGAPHTYHTFQYWDCCGPQTGSCSTCTQCIFGCPQPQWCNSGNYYCSLAVRTGVQC
jgi:hypothetical protein